MNKKKALILLNLVACMSAVTALAIIPNMNKVSLDTVAIDEPYTLTIDENNFSNFSYVEDNLYRGTFKTALGNDITFTTDKNVNTLDNKIYWNVGNYLKSENALTGLKSIEVTATANIGDKSPYRNYPTIRAEMLVDPNQPESFYYVDKTTNSRNLKTYTMSIAEEGSGNYVNLKMVDIEEGVEGQLIISSVKFYFSCSNTMNSIEVASSNDSYGTVSIEGSDYKRTAVKNGTSVTVHANPTSDFENEQLYSFKGWHLNGSEEYISTNPDYTFTTVIDASYSLVADFGEAETELFSHGEKGIAKKDYPHTFVYSEKATKYYSIIGAHDPNGTHTHTDQSGDRNDNKLFIEEHKFISGGSTYKSYFKLNAYSPSRLVYDIDQGRYVDKKWVEDDQIEMFDPTKVQAVIFYLAMDGSGKIDELSSTNGTFTTYSNLQDPLDENEAMSKVVWTGFTSDEADVYVPSKYWNGEAEGTLWIKRMKVVYR